MHVSDVSPIVAIAVVLICVGCSFPGSDEGPLEELQANRELWEQQDLDDYRFHIQIGCFCPPYFVQPSTVVVRTDTVNAVLDPSTGEPHTTPTSGQPLTARQRSSFPTMDELFDQIEDALHNDADELEVQYDADRGFIRQASIDPAKCASDDDVTYKVSNLQPDDS